MVFIILSRKHAKLALEDGALHQESRQVNEQDKRGTQKSKIIGANQRRFEIRFMNRVRHGKPDKH
jgi:hypothetical protein